MAVATARVGKVAVASPAAAAAAHVLGAIGYFTRRQPLGMLGAVVVLVLIVTAVLAPQLAPHGAKDADFSRHLPPSAEFPMGTDHLGRDVLSRVVWGTRLSLYQDLRERGGLRRLRQGRLHPHRRPGPGDGDRRSR